MGANASRVCAAYGCDGSAVVAVGFAFDMFGFGQDDGRTKDENSGKIECDATRCLKSTKMASVRL